MRYSELFYVANGGGCCRLPLDADGKIIDGGSPDINTRRVCEVAGEHPHAPQGRLVGPERVRSYTGAPDGPQRAAVEASEDMVNFYARKRAGL